MPSSNMPNWNRIRYSLYAPLYDVVIRIFDGPRRRSIDMLRLDPDERVLIVGCGTGRDLLFLPDEVEITAGDITPAMVRRAEKRAAKLGAQIQTDVFDAAALPYPDASFDAAILHLILAVVPDPETAIREVKRVLKPGGRIAIFDKFLSTGRSPSVARRAANSITRILFTDINRSVEPLLQAGGLEIVHDQHVFGGEFFRIITARKPA